MRKVRCLYKILVHTIEKNQYKNIEYKLINYDNIPLAVSSITNAINGEPTFQRKERLPCLGIFTLHFKDKKYIACVWHKKDKYKINNFLKTYKSKLEYFNLCILESENTAINPTWWEKLDKSIQREILEHF